jgi:predicted dehydrogenase
MTGTTGPVRIALAGCGAVSSQYYAPALQELQRAGEVVLAAVFDPDKGSAERLAAQFPTVAVADSFDALQAAAFDLAVVASPPALHASQSMQLLRAGRAVLCEKPMATTLLDAQAMVEAAAESRVLLAVGMVRRFFPAAEFIREAIALGILGDLNSFDLAEGSADFRWPVTSPRYFQRQQSGGGVLMDIGVHVLDLLTWWLGEPVALEYADDAMGGIEANCLVSCTYASGLQGKVRLSRDAPLTNCVTLRGSRGWLRWSANVADAVEIGLQGSQHLLEATLRRAGPAGTSLRSATPAYNFEQSFVSQLRNVARAVQGREPLRVPASDALAAIRQLEHCYDHRSLLAMDWLGDAEIARARQLQQAMK